MSVLDLINAIQAGNSQDIETHFESEMNNRIAERLDDMRAYVAKSMFNEDVDVYDYEDVITESDIEAFMQTEEFEQLDELSKKTLGSYVKKAANDMAISYANRMVKAGEADEVDRFMNRNTSVGCQEKHGVTDNLKKALGADSESVNKHMYRSLKRSRGIDTAIKKLTKEDIDQLEENKVPAGIKLFHHDKEGKESYSIHFSAQDAQREEKRRKKMGHKTVAHALVYGQNDEGERVNH